MLVAAISRVGEMPGPFRSKGEIILKIRGWGCRPGPRASLSWASGRNEVTDNAVSPGQEGAGWGWRERLCWEAQTQRVGIVSGLLLGWEDRGHGAEG